MTTGFCKFYVRVAWTITAPKEALFSRLRCKSWTCDFCAKKNASIWRAWLQKRLPEVSDTWWLVTITANEHKRESAQSLHNIRSHLDSLFKRIKRCFNAIEYVRVYEKHPTSDAIHAHLIMSGLTPFVLKIISKKGHVSFKALAIRTKRTGTWTVKSWFKVNARELKMGYMVDVQQIDNAVSRAIWYVTKYLTKSQQDLRIPYLRHVQVSRGIGSPKESEDHAWQVGTFIESRYFAPGTKITDLNTGFVVNNNWWEVHSFYPLDVIEAELGDQG